MYLVCILDQIHQLFNEYKNIIFFLAIVCCVMRMDRLLSCSKLWLVLETQIRLDRISCYCVCGWDIFTPYKWAAGEFDQCIGLFSRIRLKCYIVAFQPWCLLARRSFDFLEINKLQNMLAVLGHLSFCHITREANEIADSLAEFKSSMEGRWISWDEPLLRWFWCFIWS